MEPKTRVIKLKNGSIKIVSSIVVTEEWLVKLYETVANETFDEIARRKGYMKQDNIEKEKQ